MQVTVMRGQLETQTCDLLIVNEFAGNKTPGGATGAVDKALGGIISKLMKEESFESKEGQVLMFRTLGKLPAKWVAVVGLGDRKTFFGDAALEVIRRAAAMSVKKAKEVGARSVVSVLHGAGAGKIAVRDSARAITEGAMLANYKFTKFREADEEHESKKGIRTFTMVDHGARKVAQAAAGVTEGMVEANGVLLARDLVNEPSLHMTPLALKSKAEEIARASKGKIKIKSYDRAALEKMNAGGILGVAMGSDHPSYLVHLIWKPSGAKKRVALVGKAITFDSGGLSLKTAEGMATMKCDMSGAALVLGVFSTLTQWNPKVEIHGIFAACENMPSGKAIRPGDIVRTMSGKTIEVLNTDAEGRVTLADSLFYASKLKPDYMIDYATLTGACVVALGDEVAGLMTPHAQLGARIKEAAKQSGEYVWELPLVKEYRELTLSKMADVKNIAGRPAGAITAGLFLKEFVGTTPWAHLDIAGPAFVEHEVLPYAPLGGTGFGVRTTLHFLKNL